jgi:hypothetical protein
MRARSLESSLAVYPKLQQSLRQYVDSWLAVRPNAYLWALKNPALWKATQRVLRSERRELQLTTNEGAFFSWRPHGRAGHDAAQLFLELLTSPLGGHVGKCKRERCPRYYFSPSGHRKTQYCPGGKCARLQTAKEANQQSRNRKREDKLRRVKEAFGEWHRLSVSRLRQQPKKAWAAKRAAVTEKFITRWENKGEL